MSSPKRTRSPTRSPPKRKTLKEMFANETGRKLIDDAIASTSEKEFKEFIKDGGLIQLMNNGDLSAFKYLYKLYPDLIKDTPFNIDRLFKFDSPSIVKKILPIKNYHHIYINNALGKIMINSQVYDIVFKQLDEKGKGALICIYIDNENIKGVEYALSHGLDEEELDLALQWARSNKTPSDKDLHIIEMLVYAGAKPRKDSSPNLLALPKPKKLA